MRWKQNKTNKRVKSSPFVVLPRIEVVCEDKMPKNPGLRLFTKTWQQPQREPENGRPLTATLEKPQVLDINLVTKIDMSLIRKEFLCITNLCRVPLDALSVSKARRKSQPTFAQNKRCNTPLSLPNKVQLKKSNRPCTSEDSWEDDQSSSSQTYSSRSSKKSSKMNKIKSPLNIANAMKQSKAAQNDANNNTSHDNFKTYRVPKNRNLRVSVIDKTDITKLPQPCKTCGRVDQPERFHSHPDVPSKPSRKLDDKIPAMKNTVQKPVAIRYKSKLTEKKKTVESPAKKRTEVTQSKSADLKKTNAENVDNGRAVSVKGPRTVTCYICGREFGTMSLPLHEPKCLEKWERENAGLPPNLRRKRPVKPDGVLTKDEWNAYAWESSQANLVPCENCGRTFYPDRLVVHQRSCKPKETTNMKTRNLSAMALEKSKSMEADLNLKIGLDIPEEEVEEEKPKIEEKKPLEMGEPKASLCQKAKWIVTHITVEPIMLCYVMPNVMASLATQNLTLEKACRVNLRLGEDICDAMTARNASAYDIAQEEEVQKAVATMNAYKNVIQSLLPSMLLMFLGSWSDRHNRRKPCIILPLFGEIVSCAGFLLCTYFFYQLPMEFNVMSEAIPPAITGGWFCMFMGVFSYISGKSSVKTRTLRIGAVNMFSNVSISIGIALSGILYKKIGFYGVFSLALSLYATGVLYGLIRVKEAPSPSDLEQAVVENKRPVKTKNFFADFFDLQHISETFKVAFKEGKRNRKKRVCIMMILVMVIIGPLHGEMNVMYLFLRYKFGWNEMDYSIYSTFHFVVHMIGTLFSLVFFSKFLKVDDAVLGMISSMSKIASSFVYTFAPTSTIFYLGAIMEMFNGTSFIAMRSITSKLVPPEELGKINSLFGVSEALMPLVYGPMYSFVYKRTIDTIPGSFLLLGGVLTTPSVAIFFWLYLQHKKDAIEDAKEKEFNEKLLQQQQQQKECAKQSNEDNLDASPVPAAKPRSIPCKVCGRLFGTKSIKIHEPQCLKKWHLQNDHLPPNEREPVFQDIENPPKPKQLTATDSPQPEKSSSASKKPPMFLCYLCGRLFSVNSIYIHEPQCLKKWKIENDKLPPHKRRPEPLKPDIKFTPDGKLDQQATGEANWVSHLQQLVPCRMCGRTFNPDRVDVHERSCKGRGRRMNDIKVEILQ